MRIHIIGINYWPEVTGIAVFSTGRAEHLASAGHDVTMCAAVPYYPQWRVPAEYRGVKFTRESRAGVTILRCPLYVPAAVNPIRRVLHEASFIASAFVRSLCSRRPDILFVVSPPLGLAIAAAILGWLWRVPYVFHVADLQPDTALDLGMVRPGRFARLLYAVERLGYRHAAIVSTLTEAMRARIIAKGIPAEKVMLFADWADPQLFALAGGESATSARSWAWATLFWCSTPATWGSSRGSTSCSMPRRKRDRIPASSTCSWATARCGRISKRARVRWASRTSGLQRSWTTRDSSRCSRPPTCVW
jgi:colanic acid biosynthesis glycosyl transferase WcaI